jgi:vacuolar iron transporter family protein
MEHTENHLKSSAFITDVVIGMSDGLTVPFALAAGLSGAVNNNNIIITAGIAEIVAGSIAMGLGGYLAGKTEIDHYFSELKKEYEEVERIPEKELEEVKEVFADYGLNSEHQTLIANALAKDKHKWVDFMMRFELGLDKPDPNRAKKSALTIGVSYMVGGFIPLMGYMFSNNPQQGLIISAIITVCCLFIFGYFKSKVTGQPVLMGAVKVTVIGIIAAAAAFIIAKLVS